MRLNFDSAKFGKCLVNAELRSDYVSVDIWHGPFDHSVKVEYQITITGAPVANQLGYGAAQEDAARIAVGHFEQSSGSNHMIFKFPCTPITVRWGGQFTQVLGG